MESTQLDICGPLNHIRYQMKTIHLFFRYHRIYDPILCLTYFYNTAVLLIMISNNEPHMQTEASDLKSNLQSKLGQSFILVKTFHPSLTLLFHLSKLIKFSTTTACVIAFSLLISLPIITKSLHRNPIIHIQ